MSACVTHIKPAKACSGKCMGGGSCGKKTPRVWVAAACEGLISLFERQPDGHITAIDIGIFPSMAAFQQTLVAADHHHELDQLIIVGTKSDIAWTHTALPEQVAKHVAAEINYPLLSGWFKEPSQLAGALEKVFSN